MSAPAFTTALWQRLAAHDIGPAEASLSFAARLARENRWREAHADAVIHEYKRFCYLACTAGHEVTPSDAVDQVWHLHLTYSRDYWEVFCPEVLQADLHHGPTAGGKSSASGITNSMLPRSIPMKLPLTSRHRPTSGPMPRVGLVSIQWDFALTLRML